jgi:hypothetical protein
MGFNAVSAEQLAYNIVSRPQEQDRVPASAFSRGAYLSARYEQL